ncbi:hypothetical protein GON09_002811 [Rhodococcus sp. B50]|nr:hypothetical protein [Rhodococcus sp. B50]
MSVYSAGIRRGGARLIVAAACGPTVQWPPTSPGSRYRAGPLEDSTVPLVPHHSGERNVLFQRLSALAAAEESTEESAEATTRIAAEHTAEDVAETAAGRGRTATGVLQQTSEEIGETATL